MVGFNCHLYSKRTEDDVWYANQEDLWVAEQKCNETVLSYPYPNDEMTYCPAKWDKWGCWNYTLANTTAYIPCPEYIQIFDNTEGNANHFCTEDGDWLGKYSNHSWANYLNCMSGPEKENRVVNIFIVGYSVSVITLMIAFCICTYFRQLACVRITIHKNLFVTFILTGISWILYYTVVIKNHEVLTRNPVWCQILHIICQYFVTCNFFWMFCEGLYLHTLVVVVFISEKKLLVICCLIGWGTPVLLTLLYSLVRGFALAEITFCWMYDSCTQWIIFGPIIITLLISTGLLIDIVRVLIKRFGDVHTQDNSQNKKAVRAAVILIPLLGLQFFLIPVHPPHGTVAEHVVQCISAIVVSFQGFIVALIYCFFNGEVLSLLTRKCRRYKYIPVFHRTRGSVQTGHTDLEENTV